MPDDMNPADAVETTDDAPQTDEETTAPEDGDEGAGSKRAVLADLARERRQRQAMEAELEELREKAMTGQEKAIAQARREAAEEVRSAMRGEILATKLTAAAVGRLADPDDAAAFIDISELEDDPQAIRGAIDALLERKPHLAASVTRSTGFDAGARGASDPTDPASAFERFIKGQLG